MRVSKPRNVEGQGNRIRTRCQRVPIDALVRLKLANGGRNASDRVGIVDAELGPMRLSKLALLLLVSSLLGSASSLMTEGVASACGGCFAPPQNNTVVTDHRMILAIGSNETTLYDQIRYQGSPESFAWVLPIRGEVKVGISSDAVFSALDQISSVQVIPPPRNCPPPPDCRSSNDFAASENVDASVSDSGVTVLRQETVGPYETVQLRSTDTQALNKWLTEKGYRITPEIEPVIANYVAEKFDFLALKLVPGK